jgi:hypothetical protein
MPFPLPQSVNIPGDLASLTALAPTTANAVVPTVGAPAAAAPAIAANAPAGSLAPLLTAGLP